MWVELWTHLRNIQTFLPLNPIKKLSMSYVIWFEITYFIYILMLRSYFSCFSWFFIDKKYFNCMSQKLYSQNMHFFFWQNSQNMHYLITNCLPLLKSKLPGLKRSKPKKYAWLTVLWSVFQFFEKLNIKIYEKQKCQVMKYNNSETKNYFSELELLILKERKKINVEWINIFYIYQKPYI